jgi:hypothetical protein
LNALRTFLVESTWGYPIISAIHVLGLAWFGGTILISAFGRELRMWRRLGIVLLLASGAVLYWLQPGQYNDSIAFRAKLALIVVTLLMKPASPLAVGLWVAIIFASRGIAYW